MSSLFSVSSAGLLVMPVRSKEPFSSSRDRIMHCHNAAAGFGDRALVYL